MNPADQTALDRLTATFFRAFSPQPDGVVRLDAIREVFVPGGVIVKTCPPAPEVYTVDSFIAPRERLLNDGTLQDFVEEEVWSRTEVCGNFAVRLSAYRKAWRAAGRTLEAKGMKTISFVRTGEGWRMASLVWDDEREGFEVPPTPPGTGR